MIKASLMYPYAEGARFDFEYYTDKHLPFVKASLGPALKGLTAEKGLVGGTPDTPPPFIVCGHLYFESVEAMQEAYAPHAAAIRADIRNFTDLEPVMMISDVLIG
ncbi:EthD family reductase [Streptomyces diastatochromogenes]|uniref:Ethyl tert-butyl ether degradation protein EthD n=1 Tax=Streptomyces diastatochromogenes TaxID=42236 RepID=A0A233RRR8_STRDA|nr:EthD family reductase [Streptomyces diastatochromogenes]MCZ0984735.1 EthD family reductase [Streptomyces diastatochromogenes]OXY86093.1 ethyl tert-butyl ether degradation protein EthD [Streptomyces diastatochromogenes]